MGKVINMFGRKEAKTTNTKKEDQVVEDLETIENAVRRNEANRKRLIEERNKANKNVTRSYNLKK